jgi:SAM-dependent methyltransferase
MMNRKMEKYYAQRAAEYDRIYEKPERQADLAKLKTILSQEFASLNVLETACGTGFWTQYIAKSARSILATDFNPEVIQLAVERDYRACPVSFAEADAYTLQNIAGKFSGGFAGFWWSHIPIGRREEFLRALHSHLSPGAKVVMIDNAYVEGSSTPISHRDEAGNTYQMRKLDDGSTHEVLKNFPSEKDFRSTLADFSTNLNVTFFQYFWMIRYECK